MVEVREDVATISGKEAYHVQLKSLAVYAAIFVDILAHVHTQPMFTTQFTFHVLVFCLQLCTTLGTAIAFYTLLGETFLMKKALYSRLLVEFQLPLGASLGHFVFFVIARLFFLSLQFLHVPSAQIWKYPGFFPVLFIQRIVGVLYHIVLVLSTRRLLADARLYSNLCLQGT